MVIAAPTVTVSEWFRGRKKFDETALLLIQRCVCALGAGWCIHQRFIPSLKPPFKIPAHHHDIRGQMPRVRARAIGVKRAIRETSMAYWKIVDADGAALDRNAGTDAFFELGMMYATGRSVPTDFVTAHKWFNIAVLKGNREAIRLRREIAAEMSDDDIAAAQRAARDWLSGGEEPAGYRAAA
jgi:uncharacterized protein